MSRRSLVLFAALSLCSFLLPLSATASVIEATALPFTGDPLTVAVSIDDGADPDNLVITLDVTGGDIGDLRGFFAHVSDESLLSGLFVVSGLNSSFDADSVARVGGGNNLNGGGTLCPCDLGIEIGSPGIGSNDIQSVTFTLSHTSQALDVSLFAEQAFGVRATSVGPLAGRRDGSSKLIGTFPVVPEPSTAMLMALGFLGLGISRRDSGSA
jgi:hypothetical protein